MEGIIKLLNCETKRDLELHCRSFVLRRHDFAAALWYARSGVFAPYGYTSCFRQWSPDHLALTEHDLTALAVNGIGPLKPDAKKTVNKASQMFLDRRMLAAHLFYTSDHAYWFLFYFDQRDTDKSKQHWKYGPHIHLISHHWSSLQLDNAWQQVQEGGARFASKIHLRFES